MTPPVQDSILLETPSGSIEVGLRIARVSDVPEIRRLLADDILGAGRELPADADDASYLAAFGRIEADPRNELWVAERRDGSVGAETSDVRLAGTYQVTYIPYLSRGGNERAHIEAVRVSSELRNHGLGAWMMRFALDSARERGCLLAQLTTDKTRHAAHRFYRKLGFAVSHEGMKLDLTKMPRSNR